MLVAVAVVLAVRLVVAAFVTHDVGKRIAVVRRDEIDARKGRSTALLENIGRAVHAFRELAGRTRIAAPEAADGVATSVVPLGPAVRECAELVAAGTRVPGLGDQFCRRQLRIGADLFEQRMFPGKAVVVAPQHGGQVEAKAVEADGAVQVAQAVEDDLLDPRVVRVNGVTAAGVVDVARRIAGFRLVVSEVVDAAERQHRSVAVALAGVVVSNVKYRLESGIVDCVDHVLQFARRVSGTETGHRREEADRVVAPVIAQPLVHEVMFVDPCQQRHQFDTRNAERLDISENLFVAHAAEAAAVRGRYLRVPHRVAAQVALVEQGLGPGNRGTARTGSPRRAHDRQRHAPSIVVRAGRDLAVLVQPRVTDVAVPIEFTFELAGIRVEQQLGGITAQADRGIPGAVDAKAVALSRPAAGHKTVPHAVITRGQVERELVAMFVEQAQLDALGHPRPECEIDAIGIDCCAGDLGAPWKNLHQPSASGSRCQMSSL